MRRNWIQIIHVAKNRLGLDDDAYRALLHGAAGISSSREISTKAQFSRIMKAFEAAGFSSPKRQTGDRQLEKCFVLWKELHGLGAVRNGSFAAMQAYVSRMTGKQDIYRPDQLSMVIESLKKWTSRVRESLKREGA